MGHEIHSQVGILLDTKEYSESGKILYFLTREFGIIVCIATGVREIKSKMRGSIVPLCIVSFDYVEGREVNRLTGIQIQEILIQDLNIEKRKAVSNIINFILRTVVGQTPNESLYENTILGFLELSRTKSAAQIEILEIIWLLKILVSLGYWEMGKYDSFTKENFETVEEIKKELVEEINKAIKSTQL